MYRTLAVNALTLSRVLLTVLFGALFITAHDNFLLTVMLLALIYATDFFDGRLARKLNASTHFGAVFDVAADLLFMIVSYMLLSGRNILPVWALPAVLLKFLEFCITSSIANRNGKSRNSVFLFDKLGKAAIAQFYALPLMAVVIYSVMPHITAVVAVSAYAGILVIMACISSAGRINMCMDAVRLKAASGRDFHANTVQL